MLYHIQRNGQDLGQYDHQALSFMLRTGKVSRNDLYWQEGNTEWLPLSAIESELVPGTPIRIQYSTESFHPSSDKSKDRGLFVVLGLLFGFAGAHNFYAERWLVAIVQLVLSFILSFFALIAFPAAVIGFFGLFVWVVLELLMVKP